MSRLSSKTQLVIILIALATIPLLYASLLVWSVKDPTGTLDTMSAAIVNEDKPATTEDGDELNLGEDLTEELLDSDDSFAWEAMSSEAAYTALEDGDIRAILEVPEDFSAAAASLGEDDPMKAATSQLSIITDDASNIIAGNIAATVGEAVRSTISQQVSETFLAQVTVGFNDISASLDEATDGAEELSSGTASAHSGAGELVFGLDTLTDGAYDLSDGASQLAAGLSEASDGASQLSDGIGTLDDQTADLPETARAIDSEAHKVAGDIRDIADKVDNAATGVDNLATDVSETLDDVTQLEGSAQQLGDYTDAALDDTGSVSTRSQDLLDQWDELSEDQRKAALEEIAGEATTAHDALGDIDQRSDAIADKVSELRGQSSEGGSGLSAIEASANNAQELLNDVHEGAERAGEGSLRMYEGADQLTSASSTLVDSADELSGAIEAAASASSELSTGLVTLSAGADDLNDGTNQLTSGAEDAQAGAGDLQNGIGELDEGSSELATGLADGRDEVPTYTEDESDHLAGTASNPVELDEQRAHEVAGYGWGLAPYFMSLALWVGAMGYFLMRPAVNLRKIISSGSVFRAVVASIAPSFLMAIVQSALMVTFVRFVVEIDMVYTAGVYALSFFVSLTFFWLNQLLIAALGPPGRFFALVLVVLQLSAAGGTYPIETAPEFLQRVHSWLPLTHSVDGLRSLIAGGAFDTVGVVMPLVAWLLVSLLGLVIVVVVIARKVQDTEHSTHRDAVKQVQSSS